MMGQLCCSELPENLPGIIPPEKTMAENCILPVSSSMNCFFEMLDYEFHRAVRYKNAVTLIFIKLCHIDDIVGIYGQFTAERIVSEIERIIRNNIRLTDRGFMYGKDEYMIILPQTSKHNANHIIPKLQRLIEDYHFSNERGMSFNLNPKFGVASFPFNEDATNDDIKAVNSMKIKDCNSITNVNNHSPVS